jgi:hypothetical protein
MDWAAIARCQRRAWVRSCASPSRYAGTWITADDLRVKQVVEAFFARHLGSACEPVGGDFEGSSHEVRAGAEILLEIGAR